MQRSLRKLKAEETLEICKQGYYNIGDEKMIISDVIRPMKQNTAYYSADQLAELSQQTPRSNFDTVIEITEEDSVSCIHRLAKDEPNLLCLNFASAKNPGGGFLNGSLAQEESLAMSSALYISQLEAPVFYSTHRSMKSCVYTDSMIYSPGVPVFRNNAGDLAPYSTCAFITSAAVNAGVVKAQEPHIAEQIPALMLQRMDRMFALCVHQQADTLILGAWGCGVFQNDPVTIATLFKQLLDGKYKGVFKKVVYAVYSKNPKFINAFYDAYKSA